MVGLLPAFASELPHPKNCDGKVFELNPHGKIMVILASSQPLADTTREFGRSLYGWQGREGFRVTVVVDLRKSLGTLFKGWTIGKMKANLDEEGEALRPWYRANGNQGDPRPDLCAIADFDGQVSEALGWGGDEEKMKVIIFGKDGEKLWSSKDLKSPTSMMEEVRKILGPPVPTPPDAVPKKSRILLRKG
ncbi:MAG: hypothetical protein NTZ01_01055 [Verrucomicrobia bacterium]|nr:hypothetical protein [Verrucomicrobiota bacterium]